MSQFIIINKYQLVHNSLDTYLMPINPTEKPPEKVKQVAFLPFGVIQGNSHMS